MPAHPLTHHEILAIVGPFSRGGYHVDLAATSRPDRRLVWRPVDRSAEAPEWGGLLETLELDDSRPDAPRLSRTLTAGTGLAARLDLSGAPPAHLLECLGSVEPRRQLTMRPEACLALDFEWCLPEATAASMRLTRATARLSGLELQLAAPTVKGEPAIVVLGSGGPTAIDVPQDLLAVLGWDWSSLAAAGDGWRGTLRLRQREPERSRRLEREFERAVRHLVVTLREPPGQFHRRWAAARWRVYAKRAAPLLGCVVLIASTAALPRAHLSEHSPLRMLIFNVPPLLMGLFFCLREIPRIEIPPLPRRLRAPAWRDARPD